MTRLHLSQGRSAPLGATWDGEGVNFAVFSAHATRVELCLFTEDGKKERARIALMERDGDIWHVHVAGLMPGQIYGYRMHGPYEPEQGHRFNPHKLLVDPYARKLHGGLKWSDAVMGYRVGSPRGDLSFDARDSAFAVPKAVVTAPLPPLGEVRRPRVSRSETVIYEAHVRGMTMEFPGVEDGHRGKFLGLASAPVLDHLSRLGVTTVQVMPVQAFVDERFLVAQGLRNYWGYNTFGFFAPDPRYLSNDDITEFQAMVCRFHAAGIEVVMDVVYNHSGEGSELGPTLSFRGLDNRSYYRLQDNPRWYINDTGTGNTLNVAHPAVLRMVTDSLRYWVEMFHVDGFRFDLATVLARETQGFDRSGGFLDAVLQDPVLAGVKLIAEPWDIGPGGYQLGQWPHPFLEYNDKFRDGIRRFWRGDGGMTPDLAKRLLGSAELFDHSGRAAVSSVNFVTVHDGFTLQDLVSHSHKNNLANGEENRDGKDENFSDNLGVEGATDDPVINAKRAQRKRNLMATLMLAQGTPMLLAGDEIGNSQGGNNNAFAQDNPVGWVNWGNPDRAFLRFVTALLRLRRAHPVLRQRLFLHSRPRRKDGLPDLFWHLPDGRIPEPSDWQNPDWKCVCAEIRTSSATPDYAASDDVLFVVLNAGGEQALTLPPLPGGMVWECVLDTARPDDGPICLTRPEYLAAGDSVAVFARSRGTT
jgi:isoamylase